MQAKLKLKVWYLDESCWSKREKVLPIGFMHHFYKCFTLWLFAKLLETRSEPLNFYPQLSYYNCSVVLQ
jgi:hypothetical protein